MTNKQRFGIRILLSLCLLATFAVNAAADTSPNGKTYTVMRDGLYYNLVTGKTTYYELVDADYTESLVVPDAIDDIKVTKISDLNNRVDIESATFGPNITNINMSGCTYLSSIDITRCENLNCDFSNSGLIEVIIPANINGNFGENGDLEKVTFLGDIKRCDFYLCRALKTVVWNEDITVLPFFRYCSSLTTIDIPAHVKAIPNSCFFGCSSLSQVNIPEDSELETLESSCFNGTKISRFDCPPNLKNIGSQSFEGTLIEEFKFPKEFTTKASVYNIFASCKNLRKLVYPSLDLLLSFPPSFTESCNSNGGTEIYIGDELLTELTLPANKSFLYGFANTSGLKSVKISNCTSSPNLQECFANIPTLETVEIGAGSPILTRTFQHCPNLKTVTVSTKNKTTSLFKTFDGCSSLVSVSFPNVTTVGKEYNDGGFTDCTSLVSVDLPKLTIFHGNFINCTSLVSLSFPELTTFHGGFTDCTSLVSLSFPELTTLDGGYYFLENCTSLETLNFPKLTTIKNSTFHGATTIKNIDLPSLVSYNNPLFSECTSLENVNVPQITYLKNWMFGECTSLKNVTIKKISSIPFEAFRNCTSLSEFDFSNITEIGHYAFTNTGFTEVTLPESCKFENNAFEGCKKLKSFTGTCHQDIELNYIPTLEKVNLNIANENVNVRINSSISENPGNIIINGSLSKLYLSNLTELNRLEVNGVVKDFECGRNVTPKIFAIDKIEDYIDWGFTESKTPGYYSSTGEIDLYIGGEKVNNLCIPAGSTLKNNIFKGMNIEKVTFMEGDEPTTVQNNVFEYCTNLREAEFLGNVTELGNNAFKNTGFETFYMPPTVTSTGTACFDCCGNLKHVTFSPSLETISSGMFFNCASLESIIVPEGVESMGYMVSTNTYNKKLKYISLPSTFKNLSSSYNPSFDALPTSVVIYSWAKTPPLGSRESFSKNTVHVPVGHKSDYENARLWANTNIIDDLLVDKITEVSGKDVIINVPLNADVDAVVKVARYVVSCYPTDSTSGNEPIAIYEFDGEGAMKTDTRSGATSISLNIPNLEEETKYVFTIKGYTTNSDLVYSDISVATTGTVTGISNIPLSSDDIRLLGKTLIIPATYASQVMKICNIEGTEMMKHIIGEYGETIKLSLPSGLYILSVGNTTLKFRIL